MRPDSGNQPPRSTALYEAILRLSTLDECIRFFDDLCAVTELRTLEQRYAVAGCLLQAKSTVRSGVRPALPAPRSAVSTACSTTAPAAWRKAYATTWPGCRKPTIPRRRNDVCFHH